jgi:hypothetical protein
VEKIEITDVLVDRHLEIVLATLNMRFLNNFKVTGALQSQAYTTFLEYYFPIFDCKNF